MKMKPLSAGCSEGVFCQNGLAVDYPLGSRAGTMLECIALTGTHYASVHMFAHASGQLAAGAAAHVAPSPSFGVWRVSWLPRGLSGEIHRQRAGPAGTAPDCDMASAAAADRRLWEWAQPIGVVCGPSHRPLLPPDDGVCYLGVDSTLKDNTGQQHPLAKKGRLQA
jgi:hypothetical protein